MKWLLAALAAAASLWPGVASGNPCDASSVLKKGDSAPCTGALVPEHRLRLWLQCEAEAPLHREALTLCEAQADAQAREWAARLAQAEAEAEAQRVRAGKLSALLADVVLPPPVPWYETPEFVATVSIIGGAVVGALLTVAICDAAGGCL